MQEILLIKDHKRLAPYEPWAEEVLEGMREGEMVTCKLSRTRNPGHHRKYMALMQEVFKHQNTYATFPKMLDAAKIALGYYDTETIEGEKVLRLHSISFAKMDQTEFEQFYTRAVLWIITKVIPGMDKRELENRIVEILA